MPCCTENKLTVNHTRDKAADRGTSVHAVAEKWAQGEPIDGTKVAESERPYVTALQNFIEEHDPQPLDSEVLVGSPTQAYAGTFDLRAEIPDGTHRPG